MNEYDQYVSVEWEMFTADSERGSRTRSEVADLHITRVLDVGCGAGQELVPLVESGQVFGVGVDLASSVGQIGRQLFLKRAPASRVAFVRAAAEALPFASDSFDVIVCRLAIPYTHNATAFGEMARLLRPGGRLLLKIHHLRFYFDKLGKGLRKGDILSMIHACRVMLAGALYHGFGKQILRGLISPETFLTERLLRRELARIGLNITHETADSNPLTPSFCIEKDFLNSNQKP